MEPLDRLNHAHFPERPGVCVAHVPSVFKKRIHEPYQCLALKNVSIKKSHSQLSIVHDEGKYEHR